MCQRYSLPLQLAAEREFMPVQAWWRFAPKFNVAAGQYVPAIRMHDGVSEGVTMHWGLIPAAATVKPIGAPSALIGSEEIERSPVFTSPWHESQRCILPAAGFYAWQMTQGSYRQPFFVRVNDRAVFGLAAVWDRWSGVDDDVIESCTVICVPPNTLMANIANTDRKMPAILRRKDYQTWLSGTPAAAKAVLQPYRADWMLAYPVSPRINSAAVEGEGLIRPVHEWPRPAASPMSH